MIPKIDDIETIKHTLQSVENLPGCIDGTDTECISNYWDYLILAQSLNSILRFVAPIEKEVHDWFPQNFRTENRTKFKLISHYCDSGSILDDARTFQKRVVGGWYENVNNLSELIIMGASNFPDSTTKGTGMVSVELAKDAGLLIGGHQNLFMKLADCYKSRKTFVFGDAASVTNYNGFIKALWKAPAASFDSTVPEATKIREALSRFHVFPANWHHRLNHSMRNIPDSMFFSTTSDCAWY